jgi:hypothetical protein
MHITNSESSGWFSNFSTLKGLGHEIEFNFFTKMESSRSNKEPFTGFLTFNHVLHTAWLLINHALTLKSNTAKYFIGEKSCRLIKFSMLKIFKQKTTLRYT